MKKIKFSSINKRHLTLFGLVVVIAIAGYVNFNYTEETVETLSPIEDITVKDTANDEYTIAIMDRDKKRSESVQVYKDIIDSSNCDRETINNAQTMLTASAKYINDENIIENSLKAKGIEKSVVYIDGEDVTVLIYDMDLDEVTVSQIKDVVRNISGFSAEKIKIIENK